MRKLKFKKIHKNLSKKINKGVNSIDYLETEIDEFITKMLE